jgi:hypothetical protein
MGEFLNEASSAERYGKSTGSSSHPNIPNDVTPPSSISRLRIDATIGPERNSKRLNQK